MRDEILSSAHTAGNFTRCPWGLCFGCSEIQKIESLFEGERPTCCLLAEIKCPGDDMKTGRFLPILLVHEEADDGHVRNTDRTDNLV